MINLNEQSSQEDITEDYIRKQFPSKIEQGDSIKGNKNIEISSGYKISQTKPKIIKAIDVSKERDNNLLQNVQREKAFNRDSKNILSDLANQDKGIFSSRKKPAIIERIIAYKKQQQKKKSNISSKYNKVKEEQSKVQYISNLQNKKSFVIEKVPCAFCDKPITFQEMQRHHKACEMAFTCDKCQDIFPIFLQEQHQNICNSSSKLKKKSSYLKYKEQKNSSQEDKDDEELQMEEFIRQHPEIDASILRQHFLAQKQNKDQNSYRYRPQYDEPEQNDSSDEQQNALQIDQSEYEYNNDYQQSQSSKIFRGLKDYQIQNLVTDFYQKGQNKQEDQCTICTKQKEQDQIIIRLPCFHTFHKQCLVPWLQVKSICPTCKYNLKSK